MVLEDPIKIVNSEIERIAVQLHELPQIVCPLAHTFAPGVYMRTVRMPAGVLVIGAEHKTEHLNIILNGRVNVLMLGELYELQAPHVLISKPGVRKILHIIEDTEWATIHPTHETDLKILEAELIEPDLSYQLYEGAKAEYLHALQQRLNATTPQLTNDERR